MNHDSDGFAQLNPPLRQALNDLHFTTPTPIQAEAIPVLLAGGDVVGIAQTGTGKTAAYGLPLLDRLGEAGSTPRALILTPTRELALQVSQALTEFARHTSIRVLPIYGGTGYGPQLGGLKRGTDVVVGTPGRIIDHLERHSLDLSGLDMLVLDEADEMLTMGFAEDIETILAATPEHKQVALFSATMPRPIRKLAETYLRDPSEIRVAEATRTVAAIDQRYCCVTFSEKFETLARILEVEEHEGVIIFVRTKATTETLAGQLAARGNTSAAINGDMPQTLRERTIESLKSGAIDILVATDVAARGLDVNRISHVINYDLPHDDESYIHRIGRTGRAGRHGHAITIITPRERRRFSRIEKLTRQAMTKMTAPNAADVNAARVARLHEAIREATGTPTARQLRGIIEEYLAEHDGTSAIDVAAALGALSRGGTPLLLDPERPVKKRRSTKERRWNSWRIGVGRRHHVRPGQIVATLANEGGMCGSDFGRIDIHGDHSIVEISDDVDPRVIERLAHARIGDRELRIAPSSARPVRKNSARSGVKPRHKTGNPRRSTRR